jgi:HTH-type transcriptional regulator / antitoxin HigA
MELKVIKARKEYEICLDRVDKLLDKKPRADSKEGAYLQVALLLLKQYEDLHFPIPVLDSI